MNRKSLLESISRHLQKENIPFPLGEIRIIGADEQHKTRSIFISESTQEQLQLVEDEFIAFLEEQREVFYQAQIILYQSHDDMMTRSLVPLSDSGLENNWRGRLYHYASLDLANPEELRRQLLQSTWRISVRKRNADFFTRHDITPTIWQPGYSAAGMSTFEDGVRSSINYLLRQRPNPVIDYEFDRVRCFAMKDGDTSFNRIDQIDIVGGDLINDPDTSTAQIIEHFKAYFA